MTSRTRYFGPGQLQFITASTYRRAPLFLSPRLARQLVAVLEEVRAEFGFLLLGWVLMPDHFHLLLKCQPAESPSRIVQQLKQRTAGRILRILRAQIRHAWCRRTLERLRLPATVHDGSSFRLWQRRFYPYGVYTEKKLLQKLDYMHNNPVKQHLVETPDQWPWSSWRAYHLQDPSPLSIAACLESLPPPIADLKSKVCASRVVVQGGARPQPIAGHEKVSVGYHQPPQARHAATVRRLQAMRKT